MDAPPRLARDRKRHRTRHRNMDARPVLQEEPVVFLHYASVPAHRPLAAAVQGEQGLDGEHRGARGRRPRARAQPLVQHHPAHRHGEGQQPGDAQLLRSGDRGGSPPAAPRGHRRNGSGQHAGDHFPHLGGYLGGTTGCVHGSREGGLPGGQHPLSDGRAHIARVDVPGIAGEFETVLLAVCRRLLPPAAQ